MSETLFRIGITIAVPGVLLATSSAFIVEFLEANVFMWGVGAGLAGLCVGLVPMAASAVVGAWEL